MNPTCFVGSCANFNVYLSFTARERREFDYVDLEGEEGLDIIEEFDEAFPEERSVPEAVIKSMFEVWACGIYRVSLQGASL